MRVGIVLFPGSNCADDIELFFKRRHHECVYIWHKESDLKKFNIDLLILPGGFAFGDREYLTATGNYKINPGLMALNSPVSEIIREAYNNNIVIFGICNGFQILTKMELLPGKLEKNTNDKFTCANIECIIESDIIPDNKDKVINIDVANSFGNYKVNSDELETLLKNKQILLRYNKGYSNGSSYNIAGVCNINKRVFGMMPHFEREKVINNVIPRNYIYDIILKSVGNRINRIDKNNFKFTNTDKEHLQKSIEDLMSSEHISYKSTRKLLKKLYTQGEHVIQGPGENAGIIDLGNNYCLAIRIESHNHPTFIDPYNGASTGVGGILRDIFTMGARPIGVLDFLRFGNDENSTYLLNETVRGIADYGNCFGVANIGGNCYKSDIYSKNPLVNVCCLGLMKKEDIIYGNALDENEVMIYVGSRTGNEGVNGASMASKSFSSSEEKEDLKKNIQFGDPFLEKLLLEACLEIIKEKLVVGMQDMGAGGVLCSTLEVVERGRVKTNKNLGCEIDVTAIPTKYPISDCDKLISESQERMLIVAKEKNVQKIFNIFKKWDLEYSVVGKVNNTGNYTVKHGDNIIYNKDISSFESLTQDWECINTELENTQINYFNNKKLWETYDRTIGCRTITNNRISNTENNNYSIINIHEINKNLIVSWGKDLDECLKNVNCEKFKPLGLVNCLNYGHPKDSLNRMSDYLEKLTKECKEKEIPVLGGNVSLYNATDNKSINPSPILVMVGIEK